MGWMPDDFDNPEQVPVGPDHHLRPIRAADVDLDYPAVMGSRERLWEIYGRAWGWPPEDMDRAGDLRDLEYHEREMATRSSYNYALFDHDETTLLGCVYIDPPERVGGADAEISWWVVDDLVGDELEQELARLVPRWIDRDWPIERPRYVGRDLSWDDWLALPELEDGPDS